MICNILFILLLFFFSFFFFFFFILYFCFFFFFFFNDPATTEIYTLSLHDALPICCFIGIWARSALPSPRFENRQVGSKNRSEEHTSELQSRFDLVCRLLLEKKKKKKKKKIHKKKKKKKIKRIIQIN